jgi:hypothetical protein
MLRWKAVILPLNHCGAGNTVKGMGKVAEGTTKRGGRKKVSDLSFEELTMARTADLQVSA